MCIHTDVHVCTHTHTHTHTQTHKHKHTHTHTHTHTHRWTHRRLGVAWPRKTVRQKFWRVQKFWKVTVLAWFHRLWHLSISGQSTTWFLKYSRAPELIQKALQLLPDRTLHNCEEPQIVRFLCYSYNDLGLKRLPDCFRNLYQLERSWGASDCYFFLKKNTCEKPQIVSFFSPQKTQHNYEEPQTVLGLF